MYDSLVDKAVSGWGMWGAFAIYLHTRPSRWEWVATVGIGAFLRLVYDLEIGERGYPGSRVIAAGAFLCVASLLVLGWRSLEAPSGHRAACRRSLAVIALFTYIGVCLGFYISFARLALPRKFDYFLYNFDGSLGFQPSFAAGRLLHAFRPLYWLEVMVYNSVGFWFSLLYAFHAGARRKYPVSILKLLVANPLIGFCLYFVFPAMGPAYAFHSFPSLPGSVAAAPAVLAGVPNAMPSLHFGGTLLIFWCSKPWKWLYRITGVFALLTALATLGLGEHYLIDLVAAVPYALAIVAFSSNVPERRVPLVAGAATLFLWLLFLRGGHFIPAVSWVLLLTTVGGGFLLQRRLAARLWTPAQ